MVLQRKRSLFLGLGLTVALVVAVGLPTNASAVSTLTGETLNGSSASGNSNCSESTSATFSVSGTATGPFYPGTFTEPGTFGFNFEFSSTFTITSGTTTVTGSKTGPGGFPSSTVCRGNNSSAVRSGLSYTATIHTPSGNFHDEGSSHVDVTIDGEAATLTETFASSLTAPVLIAPTSKDQCKNNGWKNFPQFKNQGQCEKSVKS